MGWKVWDSKEQKDSANTTKTTTSKKSTESNTEPTTQEIEIPDGWVKYEDTTNNVSFYHPSDWDTSKFRVHKVAVTETVKGTNFGPYSAKYTFNKAEKKWYSVNFEGNQVALNSEYATVTSIPNNTSPAVYGLEGEGGGSSYVGVFTDGVNSYMIELPAVFEMEEPVELDAQKQAIADLLATVVISKLTKAGM